VTTYLRIWPGLAVGICIVGLAARAFFGIGAAAESGATARREGVGGLGQVRLQSALWTVLLAAHLIALLSPKTILAWNAQPLRLYVLEGSGLLIGLLALGTSLRAIARHLGRRGGGALSVLFDSAFLGLVLVALVSVLLEAVRHRWASAWAAVTVAPYVQSLMDGRPRAELVTQLPMLIQLHVLAGFGALALFPFTRAAAILMATVRSIGDVGVRPALATGGRLGQWLRQHSPAGAIWPDEDVVTPLTAPTVWPKTMADERLGRGAEGASGVISNPNLMAGEGSSDSQARLSEGR
jgi:nitrate reductase gamma subunit